MNKPFTFAQRLKTLIELKGITKSDLARNCEINKSNITRYLNGEYEAKQDVIYRIARRYNVREAWLLGYDVPMKQDATIKDLTLIEQHEEMNAILDNMPPELRTHAINLLKDLAQIAQHRDEQ